jgi:hypothetical protein
MNICEFPHAIATDSVPGGWRQPPSTKSITPNQVAAAESAFDVLRAQGKGIYVLDSRFFDSASLSLFVEIFR